MRDHLTEILLFRWWVIAACQSCKLFDRGRLAVALHYTEFQAIFILLPWNFNEATCVISPRMDAPAWVSFFSLPILFVLYAADLISVIGSHGLQAHYVCLRPGHLVLASTGRRLCTGSTSTPLRLQWPPVGANSQTVNCQSQRLLRCRTTYLEQFVWRHCHCRIAVILSLATYLLLRAIICASCFCFLTRLFLLCSFVVPR